MTITKSLITLLCLLSFSHQAFSYNARSEEEKGCKKPKFRTFVPEHLSEVEPGSEISFHVSNWAEPGTIKAEARKIPVKLTIIDKTNFFVAKGRLPGNLQNTFARINLFARSKEGGCLGQGGWLLKIKPEQTAAETSNSDNAQSGTESTQ